MRTKWPKDVPVLDGKDFCRDAYDTGERHCLAGWCKVAGLPAFNPFDSQSAAVADVIRSSAVDLGAITKSWIAGINDNRRNSKALLARIWNRAMAKLGYVVNNPEAKYLEAKG